MTDIHQDRRYAASALSYLYEAFQKLTKVTEGPNGTQALRQLYDHELVLLAERTKS
jgi:hypothetical protein